MRTYEVPTAEIVDFAHDYVVAAPSGGSDHHSGSGANSIGGSIDGIGSIEDLH